MGLDHWIELRSTDDLSETGENIRQWRKWYELHDFVQTLWEKKEKKPSVPLKLTENELAELLAAIGGRDFNSAKDILQVVEERDAEYNIDFNLVPFELDADDWEAVKKFITESPDDEDEDDDGLDADLEREENTTALEYIDSELENNPKLRVFYNSWH